MLFAAFSAVAVNNAVAATPAPAAAKPVAATAATGGITGTQIAIGAATVGVIAVVAGGSKGSSGTK